jgi:hypothetical protein
VIHWDAAFAALVCALVVVGMLKAVLDNAP